jgi:hypothetical protein
VLLQEIENDDPGDGWAGDSPEREWANAMIYFTKKKLPKVEAAGFVRYPENWLLIYDNWQLPDVDFNKAAYFLCPLLKDSNAFLVFDKIFILISSHMCEFSDNRPVFYQLTNPRIGI